jgi:hypothetical protein
MRSVLSDAGEASPRTVHIDTIRVVPRRAITRVDNCPSTVATLAALCATMLLLWFTGNSDAYTALREGRFFEGATGSPTLIAAGGVLSWDATDPTNSYKIRRTAPGRPVEYAFVKALAVLPPAIPGATVGYSVKAVLGGTWSPEASVTYPATATLGETIESLSATELSERRFFVKPTVAPELAVAEDALSWEPVDPTGSYVIRRKMTEAPTEYALVKDVSTLPPAIAGQTVSYDVKAALGTKWSPAVAISYPAIEPEEEEQEPPDDSELPVEGKVLWRADGSKQPSEEWASVADQVNCATPLHSEILPDGRVSLEKSGIAATSARGRAYRFFVPAGDRTCYSGRSELAMSNPTRTGFPTWKAGREAWIALEVLFGKNYPLARSVSDGGSVLQLHEFAGPGSPPLAVGAGSDPAFSGRVGPNPGYVFVAHKKDSIPGNHGAYEWTDIAEGVKPGIWYRLLLHVKFSLDSSGFIFGYWGKASEGAPTLKYQRPNAVLGVTGFEPTHLRIGDYPDQRPIQRVAQEEWISGTTIATSREAAEAGAF